MLIPGHIIWSSIKQKLNLPLYHFLWNKEEIHKWRKILKVNITWLLKRNINNNLTGYYMVSIFTLLVFIFLHIGFFIVMELNNIKDIILIWELNYILE